MRGQRGEGGDGHVVAIVSFMGGTLVLCGGHDLGFGLAILVRDRTLRMAAVRLVLGTSLVLDIVTIALFTLHDAMDGARGPYCDNPPRKILYYRLNQSTLVIKQ
jgi:hypothetical protein